MGGAGQVEGGIDQMWSTDQRGMHMPWTGVPVSPPVGALSLLEIQEQEFKHAEQKVGGRRGGARVGNGQSGKENSCSTEYMHKYIRIYVHTYIHACIHLCSTLPLSMCECSCVAESVYHVNFHCAVFVDC